MFRATTSSAIFALSLLIPTSNALSASPVDPCKVQGHALSQAQRNQTRADSRARQAEDRYYRLEDSLSRRELGYSSRLDQARANLDLSRANNTARNTNCVIRTIFWGRGGSCWAGSLSSNARRQAQARYRITSAETQLRNFQSYAEGARYRESQRLLEAQNAAAQASSDLTTAQDSYALCLSENPPQ